MSEHVFLRFNSRPARCSVYKKQRDRTESETGSFTTETADGTSMDGTTGTVQRVLAQPLRPLGVTVGVLLVVATLAAVAGTPWQTHASMAAAIVQMVAAVLMSVLGVGLAYISWAADA
ncbi:hypothetical protein [Haloarcula sp. CGMCC 1.6347]|uniref:hypothetical protein n=1 Tax=Haloarcula sp. CGMCC 1.6347 TaxID=3111455 RepID=UPI00300EFAF6